jgi:hypothetical protein
MTYRELGRTPINILCIRLRIVNFWNRLISNEKKLSCILYKIMFNLSVTDNVQFKWLIFIKSIFEKTGLNYLWNPYVIKFGVVVLTPKIFLQN